MDPLGEGPRAECAVGQEAVAGDDAVDPSDRAGEPCRPLAAVGTSAVVGVAEQDRVVEVEDQAARPPAQLGELPARQELALEDYALEVPGAAELGQAGDQAMREALDRQRAPRGDQARLEGTDPG